jgi:hypothetical protein
VGNDDFRAQVEQVFKNLKAAVEAARGNFHDIIKLNFYCVDSVDPSQISLVREIRDKYVNTQNPPTSTFVVVRRLVRPEWLIDLISFSLFWGGFAIFWEAGVSGLWGKHSNGQWIFGMLWGIPFVVIGQYLIWGRFVYAAWLKRRTYYAVTNRRVLVIQDGWKRQVASAYIDSLPSLSKEGCTNGIGILRFGPEENLWSNTRGWRGWNALSFTGLPTFVDIDDVDSVYRLVSDLRERSRASKPT